jgi:hypothetical protein
MRVLEVKWSRALNLVCEVALTYEGSQVYHNIRRQKGHSEFKAFSSVTYQILINKIFRAIKKVE